MVTVIFQLIFINVMLYAHHYRASSSFMSPFSGLMLLNYYVTISVFTGEQNEAMLLDADNLLKVHFLGDMLMDRGVICHAMISHIVGFACLPKWHVLVYHGEPLFSMSHGSSSSNHALLHLTPP
jgi:hypothetical protein